MTSKRRGTNGVAQMTPRAPRVRTEENPLPTGTLPKVRTSITGLDEITGGGLSRSMLPAKNSQIDHCDRESQEALRATYPGEVPD